MYIDDDEPIEQFAVLVDGEFENDNTINEITYIKKIALVHFSSSFMIYQDF